VKLLAFLADSFQHVQNCVRVTFHDSGSCANTKPLCQQLDDLHNLVMVNAQPVQWLLRAECLVTAFAAIALHDAVFVPKTT
jgi:hypothetical protein